MSENPANPAEKAAQQAWTQLRSHFENGSSFVFEAGAGAGKTHSLIESLKFLIRKNGRELERRQQQIACITFTNVARDTIIARTDGHPIVYCETTHAFAWNLISGFKKQLRAIVTELTVWQQLLVDIDDLESYSVEYALGRRAIEDRKLLLHHDDIFPIIIRLLANTKFRTILTSRFPVILIDEYQDTDASLMAALAEHFFGKCGSPQFGFYGDHWQKIYGDGCGSVDHASLKRVEKGANFRSVKVIVDSLNNIRPELPQLVKDPDAPGMVRVWHTNGWRGNRQTRNHWQGDLPEDSARVAFNLAKAKLVNEFNWDFSPDNTKVLMLTHRALASELGYASLPKVFRYNESFAKKSNNHIAYFVDNLEPAALAFEARKYGQMFEVLGRRAPLVEGARDKAIWVETMTKVSDIRRNGSIGDMMTHLLKTGCPELPGDVARAERDLAEALAQGAEMTSRLRELLKLKEVPFTEVSELSRYLRGHSPFETKHGVKGAQFENVLAVFGRGWNEYNFDDFLRFVDNPAQIGTKRPAFERYRNLFYVVCSRPKTRLSLLFTQQLSPGSIRTLNYYFGSQNIEDIGHLLG